MSASFFDPDMLNRTDSVHDLCDKVLQRGACEMVAITFEPDGSYSYWSSASVDRRNTVMALCEMLHEMLHSGDDEDDD